MRLATLDPRPKMLLVVCVSTLALVWSNPVWLVGLLGVTLCVLLVGRLPLHQIARQIKGIVGVVGALFLVQCVFTRSGAPLLSVGAFTLVTAGGFAAAVGVSTRLAICAVSAIILWSGETRDYLLALVQCKVPYEVAFMVATALHFLPLLREEALDVYHAVQMRGVDLGEAGLIKKLETYRRIALPIVAGALRRAEQVSLAMEARAFRSGPRRTFLRRLRLSARDAAWLVATPLLAVAAALAERLVF